MGEHRPVTTSLALKRALLNAVGIPSANVVDVELDLSQSIAKLKVTLAVPAFVNGLITTELAEYELVSRSQGAPE